MKTIIDIQLSKDEVLMTYPPEYISRVHLLMTGSVQFEKLLKIPRGATPLCVMMRDEAPCMWMLADTKNPVVFRTMNFLPSGFRVGGTDPVYVGSVRADESAPVFHVFLGDEMEKR